MSDLLYFMALTKVKLVGAVTAKELVSHCGGAEEVFKASRQRLLRTPGVGQRVADNIMSFKDFSKVEKELTFIEKNQIQAHTYLEKSYPERLTYHNDSPLVLFQKGNATLNPPRTVAIVGTRKATPRGRAICEELVAGLAEYDVTINSGLAYGIDVTAHTKCVQLNIPTIGVLGHGLDRMYPHQHKSIAQKMLENGSLLTEFPSGTTPDKNNFPMRNRIIAGMSDAVIVVETKRSGGSIITAQIANNYNKDVFAVPGRLDDEYSVGCNFLIKTHKAALIESAADIGYIMRWDKLDGEQKNVQRKIFVNLTEGERKIVAILKEHETIGIDKIVHLLKSSTSQLAPKLLEMEFKGVIKTLPGSRYTLVR